ncbi:MAG: thiamine phosphate synthase [Roseburia sp.]|nr:thiamine phosphate synthase [Roseburia sp.]
MSMCRENVIAVTNRKLVQGSLLRQIEKIFAAGVKKLILREKDLSPQEYFYLAKEVMELGAADHADVILHFFVEEAIALGAESIHLPLGRAVKYRESLKRFQTVGISTHSPEQVRQAEELGADYVTFGHVFATDCKKGCPPKGIEALREVCEATELAVYGLGGINKENCWQVLDAGAAGYCMMSEVMRADFG